MKKRFVTGLALICLLAANVFMAREALAHQWGRWHWNKSGSSVPLSIYNSGTYRTEAANAISDWNVNTILTLSNASSHTEISVFDGNYGNTGWGGLASLESVSGNHILHAHSRLNTYYSYSSTDKRGVQCQEVGHTFGLDHSNDGCMGKGYYNNLNTTVQHNWNDIYNIYRYAHTTH
jgi:hypothetical protein